MPSVHILPPEIAKKIAAGEVIDRPASVVRELLDNAIDSGADEIILSIAGGGIDSVRVVDNGCGMSRADLALLCLPHATSKIASEDDLLRLSSLGFRGEALSSISSVSRLEILSRQVNGDAYKLSSYPGQSPTLETSSGNKGTIVETRDLFFSFPARKQFLKRSQDEYRLCKQVFLDKAVAFPDISFKLVSDGNSKYAFGPSSPIDRFFLCYPQNEPKELFRLVRANAMGMDLLAIAGGSSVIRPDRRMLQCFVNGRRVQDFSLSKAIEVGYAGFMPGGQYPLAFLFLRVDPDLVDFNIHPAKKELRFRDAQFVFKLVRSAFYESLQVNSSRVDLEPAEGNEYSRELFSDLAANSKLPEYIPSARPEISITNRTDIERVPDVGPKNNGFVYLGQCLGCFLACERDKALYLVDQHAAHERIIYESLRSGRHASQELLVPLILDTDNGPGEAELESSLDSLQNAGIRLNKLGKGLWELVSIPDGYKGTETALAETILGKDANHASISDFMDRVFASMACKAAIKDGDTLDDFAAQTILAGAFSLPLPRCPHGRPIWHRIGHDELWKLVGRIV